MPSDHDHYPFLVEISTRRGIIQEDHLRDHAGADLPVSSADVGWLSESLILLRLFIWGFLGVSKGFNPWRKEILVWKSQNKSTPQMPETICEM